MTTSSSIDSEPHNSRVSSGHVECKIMMPMASASRALQGQEGRGGSVDTRSVTLQARVKPSAKLPLTNIEHACNSRGLVEDG